MDNQKFSGRVREKIFSEMSYASRLNARLVCHQWNKEICSMFSFKVILDDRSAEFEQILIFPIYSITVQSMQEVDWKLSRLRFPMILAELIISGPISLRNFEAFLNGNNELSNLRKLGIYSDQIVEGGSGEILVEELRKIKGISRNFGFGIPFPELQSLSLSGFRNSKNPNNFDQSLPYRIFHLFLLSRFQQLREFVFVKWEGRVKPEAEDDERISTKRLFKFIARHSSTLQNLSITNVATNDNQKAGSGVLNATTFRQVNRNEVPDAMLQHLQVKRLFLSPLPLSGMEDHLAALLYKQKKLKHLNCQFHSCPFQFYKPVLIRNCHSLKELVICNLSCLDSPGKPAQELDLAPFRFCTVLQLLSLTRNPSERHICQDKTGHAPCHDITNTRNLPSSLTSLHISGFHILSDEIYTIGGVLTNLRRLELEDAGSFGEVGIGGRCLKFLLTNLSELEHIHIRGLNVETKADDVVLREVISSIERSLVARSLSISSAIDKSLTHRIKWDFDSTFPNPYSPNERTN